MDVAKFDQGGPARKDLVVDMLHACEQPELKEHQDGLASQGGVTLEQVEAMVSQVMGSKASKLQKDKGQRGSAARTAAKRRGEEGDDLPESHYSSKSQSKSVSKS